MRQVDAASAPIGRTLIGWASCWYWCAELLAEALADGRLVRNVAARVEGPPQDPKRRQALTADEVAKVAEAAEQHRLCGCWALTRAGLRGSEVMGVRWSDPSDDGGLTVERGRVLVDGHCTEVGPTKTRRGVRTRPCRLTFVRR